MLAKLPAVTSRQVVKVLGLSDFSRFVSQVATQRIVIWTGSGRKLAYIRDDSNLAYL